MGGKSSKSYITHNRFADPNGSANYNGGGRTVYQPNDFRSNSANEAKSNLQSDVAPSQGRRSVERQPQEWRQSKEASLFPEMAMAGYGSSEDEFYDGIPRFPRALSLKSRSLRSKLVGSKQAGSPKVSEANSHLGKPRSLRLGKAVEVLDTLGSSMTSLNQSSGFASGVKTKSNELQILAFEIANTIVKGSSLMQSLSKRSMRQLKEVVLTSEGVQRLVSNDMNELLTTVATDKREEIKTFTEEVVRFGNRSKDSQWHNLHLYFEKRSKEAATHKQSQEVAEQMMQQLMTLVMCTAELYNELQAMDRFFEQDYQRKRQEEGNPFAAQRGDNLAFLRTDLKSQKKLIKNLKKKSLWSKSLEEVMEKLVDIVLFLNREIPNVFGNADPDKPSGRSLGNQQRLGPSGLALHYANIVIQIDTLVARCNSVPSSIRDTLYQGLPPNMKSSLRSRLQTFQVKEGLSVQEIKDEMEKTLQWLVPVAINTAKAHHGFGWVGEWGNTGPGANRKTTGPIEVIRIETFHYADKEKTEAHVLEMLLWLNHLVKQSKVEANGSEKRPPMRSPTHDTLQTKNQKSSEDEEKTQDASNKSGIDTNAPSPKQSIEEEEEAKPQDISNNKSEHEGQES